MSGFSIDTSNTENYTIQKIVEYLTRTIDELIKSNMNDRGLGLSEEELGRRESKKTRLREALDDCRYGSKQDKDFVKEFIQDLLSKYYGINDRNINFIIPFETPERLTVQDKFDILLHVYKKEYGYRALYELIKKYRLDELKMVDGIEYFCITEQEIESIYDEERPKLNFEDKFSVLLQRVYSIYKGHNCIDDLIDMQIDGISCGVNGLPETSIIDHSKDIEDWMNNSEKTPKSYDSVWIFFTGKLIHLRFLTLGSYAELKRISQNIYKFGAPGPLNQSNGFKLNRLKDGSRVLVLRPEFCETWCFFIRKFDLPDISLHANITGGNSTAVADLIVYCIKGCMNMAVTGEQGTGKTTFINSMIEHIYHMYSLRILEMALELHTRIRFPWRNIVTVQETEDISGQAGLDILKKTDGTVLLVGEVASDPVAAYTIKMAQISKFTL